MSEPVAHLTEDQSHKFMRYISGLRLGTYDGNRYHIKYFAAALFLETGLRIGEVVGLLLKDLIFSNEPVEFLHVRPDIAKGGKKRVIPVSDILKDEIRAVMESYWSWHEAKPDHYALFLKDPCQQYSIRSLQRFVKKIGLEALGIEITPHTLRHTFATKMMAVTSMRTVQALLGHSSIRSTQIYTHPSLDDLKKAVNSKRAVAS